jgi:hypothetical protein
VYSFEAKRCEKEANTFCFEKKKDLFSLDALRSLTLEIKSKKGKRKVNGIAKLQT